MIVSTDNFIVYRGGWNCRHQLYPIDEAFVPAEVRARVENTRFAKPNGTPETQPGKESKPWLSKLDYSVYERFENGGNVITAKGTDVKGGSCRCAIKRKVNPNFCFARQRYYDLHVNFSTIRKQYDISYTQDGYLIVSNRFKQFCKKKSYKNAIFHSLPQDPDFYFFESSKIIPLDYVRRKVYFNNFCNKCNRYEEVVGAVPSYIQERFVMEENTFYRSEYDFANHIYKSPIIIISLQMAKELSVQKFKGLFFRDVLE